MTVGRASHGPDHFQRLYEASQDPWQYRTSPYEQSKYRRTVAGLGARRFHSGFEAGCSIGVLTHLLALRCERLLAVDIVERPLRSARATCANQPWVQFERMGIPTEWPDDAFDLIVLSEVLYFLSPADIATAADRVGATLEPNGVVLLVNWRGRSRDPCTGDEAATIFMNRTQRWLFSQTHYQETRYRLDILCRG
jgi:2-polyprenyl-3-methyl-5-hydroxy-6-metoxy-1,4-benzoquinol methylase